MSPTSIPSTVECHFLRCRSAARYSFKRRVQNSFMILLTLFHSFPVPLSLLLIIVCDDSLVVIPVKKCPGVRLSTSRMSLLKMLGLLLSRASTCQIRVETLFLELLRNGNIEEQAFAHPNEAFSCSTKMGCSWWKNFLCNLLRLRIFL